MNEFPIRPSGLPWNWTFPPHGETFGFSPNMSGAHLARSMMWTELQILLRDLPPSAGPLDYKTAIVDENLLSKTTQSSRLKTFRHLFSLYLLDPKYTLFRVFRQLNQSQPDPNCQMALVLAFCRDPQLRDSFRLIEALTPGELFPRPRMDLYWETLYPGRFKPAMKASLSQNVNTSWTVSDHLQGRTKKYRSHPTPTLAGATFSLFAGYLSGLRGNILLSSVFGRLAGGDPNQLLSLLRGASQRGWCRVRNAGGMMEIDFSALLTPQEQELLP